MQLDMGGDGAIQVIVEGWPGFALNGLRPAVTVNGEARALTSAASGTYDFSGDIRLRLVVEPLDRGARLKGRLFNRGKASVTLNRLSLLETADGAAPPTFGARPEAAVILVDAQYTADVVALAAAPEAKRPEGNVEPNVAGQAPGPKVLSSKNFWLAYDRDARQSLLVGFESSERWQGEISVSKDSDGRVRQWSVGFDGGDLLIGPGQEIALEDMVFAQGSDPWRLLEEYGDDVARLRAPHVPSAPPVSWCSWYPHRLGVTEERILENARIAARRLHPLGLRIMEVDLGWERDYLPGAFEENDQFPHGLKWLSEQLAALGYDLGCWKAPYTISEFDPVAKEHPEWLAHDGSGQPAAYWTWFWPPHGKVFILDLTHPGAQEWLRQSVRSLRERGVRYFKADFISCASDALAKGRHDRGIVAGGGMEAARIGARIIREELPEALLLNCGGPAIPGAGHWPLLYDCQDTGNTGVINWPWQRDNFRALACHLWKNRRWGIIQPSCLCVGLPGTLEEARVRATTAFLAGGQIDISDTLTTLPEDRWAVLEATLPPLGVSAQPVDLFEPVFDPGSTDYEAQCRGQTGVPQPQPHPAGSVWRLQVKRPWDEWDLVAVFNLEPDARTRGPRRYRIPLERIGLSAGQVYWAWEFWSGQFLGVVPGRRRNPRGYEHPGDLQDLTAGDAPDALEIAFTGPAVKLLCLRRARPHPWVLGTSFHQSGGAELEEVSWDARKGVLSGRVNRPAGQTGALFIAGAGRRVLSAEVEGRAVECIPAANGSWRLPILLDGTGGQWRVCF